MFENCKIFSAQKCSFQLNLSAKSRENVKKSMQQWAPYIINNISYLS